MGRNLITAASMILALPVFSSALRALDPAPEEIGERLRNALGVKRFVLRELMLPAEDLPESFRVALEHEGRRRVLSLRRHSVRSGGFRLLLQVRGGALVEAPPPPGRTYRGSLEDDPGSLVAASLLPGGLCASVVPGWGAAWSVRPMREVDPLAPREAHVVFSQDDVDPPDLGNDAVYPPGDALAGGPSGGESRVGAGGGEGSGGAVCLLKVADIAFDSDYEFYDRICGRNTGTCTALIEEGLNTTNSIYIRDVKITHRLSVIVIRSDQATDLYAQFPDGANFGGMLVAFRDEWNSNRTDIVRDLAYMVTGKPNPQYGGLAYVSTVCTSYAYGVGMGYWGYGGILRHELGHNWGCGHSCGIERRYIMCGNSIDAFSRFNIDQITAFSDSRTCLDVMEYQADPEPPYARPDRIYAVQGEGPVSIEFIESDTDRNCDVLQLVSHDERSAFGGEVRLLDGSAGRRESFLYSPRSDFVGVDAFRYRISDGTGFEESSAIAVEILPRALIAHFKMDETDGAAVADSSGFGHGGELRGDLTFVTASVAGRFQGALDLPGDTGKYVSIENDPFFDLTRGITVAAWFKVDAFALDGETIIAKGDSSWRLKRDGTRNNLKFTCTGLAGGEVRGSLRVDDGRWHHAAGVYDGSRLSLYIDGAPDGSVPATGAIQRNASNIHIGDLGWKGAIDEVRIYNFALESEAVAALAGTGRAENPKPSDGEGRVNPGAKLSWLPAPGATGHDVYLGTDRGGVAAATPQSPEHKARIGETSYQPSLAPDATYFWRVDGVAGVETARGEVWSFATSFAFTNFSEPPLNSSSYVPRPGAKEIGFRTASEPTGGASPFVGTIDTGSISTSPIFSHRSLGATTTFDRVDLTARNVGAAVSLELQARDTGYEDPDSLEVYVTDGASRIDLLNIDPLSGLNQISGTGYRTYAASIPGSWTGAELVLKSSSNSSAGSERYDFDSIGFGCQGLHPVIAHTYFEEVAAGARSYAPGPGAGELGFETAFSTTAGISPLAEVVEAGAPHASRTLSFRSVKATTTFRPVDLRGRRSVRAAVVLRVSSTGYEGDDYLEVSLQDGPRRIDLIRRNGDDGLDLLATGRYLSYWAMIPPDWTAAALVVSSSTNSSAGSERIDLRSVEFVSMADGPGCNPPPAGMDFKRGDSLADGTLDLGDVIRILDYLFLGGAAPGCLDAADANDSGGIDLTDAIRVILFLFLGADPPPAPGPGTCGEDPTEDALVCGSFLNCP